MEEYTKFAIGMAKDAGEIMKKYLIEFYKIKEDDFQYLKKMEYIRTNIAFFLQKVVPHISSASA